MIEALRNEEVIRKVGGRFKLTALLQKRVVELMEGAMPLIERGDGMTDMEVAIQEIIDGKLGIDYDNSDIPFPADLEKEGVLRR